MADEIVPFGETALLVRFAERIDERTNRRVHALADVLRGARTPSLGEPVPGYASLLVPFDPLAIGADTAEHLIRQGLTEVDQTPPAVERGQPPLEIHVRYGGADGPDLDRVAEQTGLTPARVIEIHASVVYRAYLLGFAPGFAYLGELPADLELPRLDTPRQRVPAGSVAIAGRQTAVYPLSTPGGWHILGRTDAPLWDVARDPPALIEAGRRVRFVAV